jgi:surfeit locus 1 family protein
MSAAPAPDRKSLIGPAIAAALVFAALVALGVWQLQRLTWKEAIISRIDARVHQAPAPLPPPAQWGALKPDDYDYAHVRAKGRYLPETEALIFRSVAANRVDSAAGPGYQVLNALQLDTGGIVLVDRGFAPLAWKDGGLRTPPSSGEVEVTGLLRPPEERNTFTPADQPDKGLWFTRDPAAVATKLGLSEVAPFVIDLDADGAKSAWPHPGATELRIPNNHLSYAWTWFGLAATLAGVFGVWVWGRVSFPTPQSGSRES